MWAVNGVICGCFCGGHGGGASYQQQIDSHVHLVCPSLCVSEAQFRDGARDGSTARGRESPTRQNLTESGDVSVTACIKSSADTKTNDHRYLNNPKQTKNRHCC